MIFNIRYMTNVKYRYVLIVLLSVLFYNVKAIPGFGPGEQEWGYANVKPRVHLFWWLFYANPMEKLPEFTPFNKPLLIWIGYFSTAVVNFLQYGPLNVNGQIRNYNLINDYNILFIDSMVGAGFSYVEADNLYPKRTDEIAKNILRCVRQFYNKLPKFQNVSTYIVAESFSGKIAAELATIWPTNLDRKKSKHYLKGVILGNPTISPIDTIRSWARYLENKEIVSKEGVIAIFKEIKLINKDVRAERWPKAFDRASTLLNIILFALTDSKMSNEFIELNLDDLSNPTNNYELKSLMNNEVKNTLGLKSSWGLTNSNNFYDIKNDYMRPVYFKFRNLLLRRNFRVILLNTQLDLNVTLIRTLSWTKELPFGRIDIWRNVTKVPLISNEKIIGNLKKYGNLRQYEFTNTKNLDYQTKAAILHGIISRTKNKT